MANSQAFLHLAASSVLWMLAMFVPTLSTSTSTSTSKPEVVQGTSPSGYCVPEEWQGGRTTTNGVTNSNNTGVVTRTFSNLMFSAKKQKIIIDDNLYTGGSGDYVRRIYDYPAKTLYTIRGFNPQKCDKTSLTDPFQPQCVPANATVVQTETSFGVEHNSVIAKELSGIQNNVNFRVTLTRDTNIPIYEELWGGNNGVNFFTTLSFYNVTISPLPDSVFTPPAVCDHVTVTKSCGPVLCGADRWTGGQGNGDVALAGQTVQAGQHWIRWNLGVDSGNRVMYRNKTYGNRGDKGITAWTHVRGVNLIKIDVGGNVVYGISTQNYIYYRTDMSSTNPTGTSWGKLSDEKFIDVAVTDFGNVWALKQDVQKAFFRYGAERDSPHGIRWETVDVENEWPECISAGLIGCGCPPIGGPCTTVLGPFMTRTETWERAGEKVGSLLFRKVAAGFEVVGLDEDFYVWQRYGISPNNPKGLGWKRLHFTFTVLTIDTYRSKLWTSEWGNLQRICYMDLNASLYREGDTSWYY